MTLTTSDRAELLSACQRILDPSCALNGLDCQSVAHALKSLLSAPVDERVEEIRKRHELCANAHLEQYWTTLERDRAYLLSLLPAAPTEAVGQAPKVDAPFTCMSCTRPTDNDDDLCDECRADATPPSPSPTPARPTVKEIMNAPVRLVDATPAPTKAEVMRETLVEFFRFDNRWPNNYTNGYLANSERAADAVIALLRDKGAVR